MRLKLFEGLKRELREPIGEKGTSKININKFIVTLVTLVTSIIFLARMGKITRYSTQIICEYILPLCKIEGTEGTEGTRGLQMPVLRLPLHVKGSLRFPQEACI
ncbi:hypothetical protein [Methanothrix soehngenii]|uniref:hypothetical protein n=1 Tax=Methanothrix soehngenii TaxID=2223 RepID=UPI00300C1B49